MNLPKWYIKGLEIGLVLKKRKTCQKNLKIYQHLGTNVTKNEKTPGNTFKNSI